MITKSINNLLFFQNEKEGSILDLQLAHGLIELSQLTSLHRKPTTSLLHFSWWWKYLWQQKWLSGLCIYDWWCLMGQYQHLSHCIEIELSRQLHLEYGFFRYGCHGKHIFHLNSTRRHNGMGLLGEHASDKKIKLCSYMHICSIYTNTYNITGISSLPLFPTRNPIVWDLIPVKIGFA